MFSRFFGPESKRQRLLKQARTGPLHDYYQQPFPDSRSTIKETPLAVLDFETTGLDLTRDHIISIGLVEIHQLRIPVETAWHQIIKIEQDMPGNTAIVHKITDDMVAGGFDLEHSITSLLQRLQGKILIAHHASIELGFLNKACLALYQHEFYIPTIDTQLLGQRILQRQHEVIKTGDLRLFNLRKRYGLPAYRAHNALSDALATAELFIALMTELYPKQDCKLKDLLTG